jgi:hypothetical protein
MVSKPNMNDAKTEDDLIPFRGKFFDREGEVEDAPAVCDDDIFLIIAGPWPNPNKGVMQGRCGCCKDFVGLAPPSVELHRRNTNRPILCGTCFLALKKLKGEA